MLSVLHKLCTIASNCPMFFVHCYLEKYLQKIKKKEIYSFFSYRVEQMYSITSCTETNNPPEASMLIDCFWLWDKWWWWARWCYKTAKCIESICHAVGCYVYNRFSSDTRRKEIHIAAEQSSYKGEKESRRNCSMFWLICHFIASINHAIT